MSLKHRFWFDVEFAMKPYFLSLLVAMVAVAPSLCFAAPSAPIRVGTPKISNLGPIVGRKIPFALSPDARRAAFQTLFQSSHKMLPMDFKLPEPISVDVAHPSAPGLELEFSDVEWVSAHQNQALFENTLDKTGGVRLFFTPPTPGYYVLDFNLSNFTYSDDKPQTLRLTEAFSPNAPQDKTVKNGDGHVLFLADCSADKAPTPHLFVLATDAITTFYSAQISCVK